MSLWVTGLLTGMNQRRHEIEQQKLDESKEALARESKVYEALINSPDETIRGMAGAGLLESINPRKRAGGIGGWLGEMQTSPFYPQLMNYIRTPQTVTVPGELRQEAIPYAPRAAGSPAALPESNPTELGAPPPTPTSTIPKWQAGGSDAQRIITDATGGEAPTESEPTAMPSPLVSGMAPQGGSGAGTYFHSGISAAQAPPPTQEPGPATRWVQGPSRTVSRLPQVFPTVGYLQEQQAAGKARGDIRAEVTTYQEIRRAMNDPEWEKHGLADALAHLSRGSSAATLQSQRAQWTDPTTGQLREGYLNYDRRTGQHTDSAGNIIADARPIISTSMGPWMEQAAKASGYTGGARTVPTSDFWRVQELALQLRGQQTDAGALAQAERLYPNASGDFILDMADRIARSSRATPPAAAAPGAPVPPPPAPPTVAAPGAPGAGTPPPAPPTVTGTPAAAPAAPQTGGGLAAVREGVNTGDVSAKSVGKPLAPEVQRMVNQARATNGLIDSAITALDGYMKSSDNAHLDMNTPEASLDLASNYRQGIYDPIESVAAQLSDLAGLQASNSAALGGQSRAFQYFTQRRQHVPRLPSSRQVEFYSTAGVPAGLVGSASRFLSEDGGFDSPALMLEKLRQAKLNNEKFIEEAMNVDVPVPTPTTTRQAPAPRQPAKGTGRGSAAGGAAPATPGAGAVRRPDGTWDVQ